MLLPVLVGVMVATWLFTLGAVGYCIYWFYKLWQVVRKDIAALNQKTDDLKDWAKNELGLRAAKSLSDEELFRFESIQRRQDARSKMGLSGLMNG